MSSRAGYKATGNQILSRKLPISQPGVCVTKIHFWFRALAFSTRISHLASHILQKGFKGIRPEATRTPHSHSLVRSHISPSSNIQQPIYLPTAAHFPHIQAYSTHLISPVPKVNKRPIAQPTAVLEDVNRKSVACARSR